MASESEPVLRGHGNVVNAVLRITGNEKVGRTPRCRVGKKWKTGGIRLIR